MACASSSTTRCQGIFASPGVLRTFHDTVARARFGALPPLPRATVVTTERIVEHLSKVEQELREVLVALGLSEPPG